MSKRDLIGEILAKKERNALSKAGYKFMTLNMSYSSLDNESIKDNTVLSLYIVGLAACIEIAVRDKVRQLIDYGSPFVDRIPGLLKKNELQFNLEIVKALQDKQISFGDFVSHLLPISQVEHINSHLDSLLGLTLRNALADIREFIEPPNPFLLDEDDQKQTPEISSDVKEKSVPPKLVGDVEKLMSDIDRLFKIRHIIAHKANFESVTKNELKGFFLTTESFINALEEYVEQTLNPNAPRSLIGQRTAYRIESNKVFNSMGEIYQEIVNILSKETSRDHFETIKKLNIAQETFLKYLDDEFNFVLALYSIGTTSSYSYQEAYIDIALCSQRVERLEEALDFVRMDRE
jgi:23S rRNA U2552 (ribose-2'-O)-methylase RlmE/FtsJ